VLSVFAVILLLRDNVQNAVIHSRGKLALQVFLQDNASAEEVQKLKVSLSSVPGVDSVTYTSKNEALARFKVMLKEDSGVVEGMEKSNPLPASLDLEIRSREKSDPTIRAIEERTKGDPIVESLFVDRGLIEELEGTLGVLRLMAFGIIGVFFLIGVAIIYNTIRLALFAHRSEIEIMELLGATPNVIRAPYLIEGCIHGVIGSFVSVVLLALVYWIAESAHAQSDVARFFMPELVFLSSFTLLALVVSGLLIGLVGSFVAVERFLVRE
jgi:cell division transport system permease protein